MVVSQGLRDQIVLLEDRFNSMLKERDDWVEKFESEHRETLKNAS